MEPNIHALSSTSNIQSVTHPQNSEIVQEIIPINYFKELKDILTNIYIYIKSVNAKKNFSLVCRGWKIVSDHNTTSLSVYLEHSNDSNLIDLSLRFEFVEKCDIPNFNFPHDPVTEKGIKNFKNLTSLNLRSNHGISNKCLENFTKLKILILSNNVKITEKGLENLTNLTDLDLSYNILISNSGILNLKKINFLSLAANSIIKNDPVCGNLTNLVGLDLSYNNVILESDIMKLTNLTLLNCNGNLQITETGISNLKNLNFLVLNAIISVEVLTGLTKLTYLRSLNLTDQGITHLTNLKDLKLCHSDSVTNVGLQNLIKLTNLDLCCNELISFKGISHLKNLIHLDVGYWYDAIYLNLIWDDVKTLTYLNNLEELKFNLESPSTLNCEPLKPHSNSISGIKLRPINRSK